MILDEVRWGLIGCGDVTEVKSGPPLQLTPHSDLVAVMRRNANLAEDYANRHHVRRWYSDAEKLILDPVVNAVYVATPPDSHAEYAMMAMRAGKPVYVEKPMARTYLECQEMIKVSEETGVPLYVAYYRRALPGFLKVKELVDTGAVGKVRFANIRFYLPVKDDVKGENIPWRYRPEVSGGGLLFDLASHMLDFLDYTFGAIGKIEANAFNQAGRYAAEDLVLANWQHGSGVAGSGAWCFATSPKNNLDEVEIVGDQGKIIFSTFEFKPIVLENVSGRQEFPFERPQHVQSYLIAKVVDALRGVGESPSTGISAARTSRVLDEMVKSFYRND